MNLTDLLRNAYTEGQALGRIISRSFVNGVQESRSQISPDLEVRALIFLIVEKSIEHGYIRPNTFACRCFVECDLLGEPSIYEFLVWQIRSGTGAITDRDLAHCMTLWMAAKAKRDRERERQMQRALRRI